MTFALQFATYTIKLVVHDFAGLGVKTPVHMQSVAF
jgi:hypothetical protein